MKPDSPPPSPVPPMKPGASRVILRGSPQALATVSKEQAAAVAQRHLHGNRKERRWATEFARARGLVIRVVTAPVAEQTAPA